MERFSETIKKALLKFFMLDVPSFSEIVLSRDVLEDICTFARQTHPKEFVAIIAGKVEDGKLKINNLYYQEFTSTLHSAALSSFFPSAANGIGTVHSHPSSITKPSDADLRFFSKKGAVHFIIGYPYTEQSIAGYDYDGNKIAFTIQ